jgi:hypothetical protein
MSKATLVLAVAAICAGCASAPQPRFAVGPLDGAPPALALAAADRAAHDADALGACFDSMAERRDLDQPLELELDVVAHDGAATLFAAAPRTPGTVIDSGLDGCLRGVVNVWRLAAPGRVSLWVRYIAHRGVPAARLASVREFRPEE